MALSLDPHQQLKYFCKICKKGFGCGRALGGHMRAHGIGDESAQIDEDDEDDDQEPWEDENINNDEKMVQGDVAPLNNLHSMRRTNPNRLKSSRVCENCGKQFFSWKKFFDHGNGKCSCDDQFVDDNNNLEDDKTFYISSPESNNNDNDNDNDNDDDDVFTPNRTANNWFRRKRSLRTKVDSNINFCLSNEEEDLANCLMMLSKAVIPIVDDHEESCASASKDEADKRNNNNITDTMDNFLINHHATPISCRFPSFRINENDHQRKLKKGIFVNNNSNNGKATLFECKACKKVFTSHQALGGHRASHKKVKGCFAARIDQIDSDNNIDHQEHENITNINPNIDQEYTFSSKLIHFDQGNNYTGTKKKPKVHECSICHRVFSSGQALGGHKRCHWLTSNNNPGFDTMNNATYTKLGHQIDDQTQTQTHDHIEQMERNVRPKLMIDNSETLDLNLDLNLPVTTQGGHIVDHGKLVNTSTECDEANSKVKLAKLSELKEVNLRCEGSSPWLQVGLGSTTDLGTDQ